MRGRRCTCGADGMPPGLHETWCGTPEPADDGVVDCRHRNSVPAGTPGSIECRFCGVTDSIRPVTATEVAA